MGITINAHEGAVINVFNSADAALMDGVEFGMDYPIGVCHDPDGNASDLNNYSWDEISEIGKRGLAKAIFGENAKKTVRLKNGETLVVQIIDYDHDVDENGNTIPMSFDFHVVSDIEKPMNEGCTNRGGWRDSDMRRYLDQEFFALLPDDLQRVIIAAAKQNRVDDSGEIVITIDKLWLKSEQEVYGRKFYSYGGEGRQYEIYKRENTPWYKENADGERVWNSLRSPYASSTTAFCIVNTGGSANSSNSGYSRGVAPGFCV